MKNIPVLLFAVLPLFSACTQSGVRSIEREDIFSLNIGPMEDQIALYNLDGQGSLKEPGLAMRDGFFYISDPTGQKIVSYNSYGDLLFMIYNEDTNPAPVNLKKKTDDNTQVTRWAYAYPLREPGAIAVDSLKHIYAEDRLPEDRYGFDSENKALLDRIVLHFDSDGRLIEYLGQEGIGGSPFPRISGLYTSVNDELAVICRLPTGWKIFWFGSGTLLYTVQLKNQAIPIPSDWPPELISSVDTVTAAPDARKLYFKVNYYRETFDESTNTRSGNEPYGSVIWILNVEDGTISGSVRLPFYETTVTENGRSENVRMLYSMLGAIKNERFFLYSPTEDGFSIMVVSANSQDRPRGVIRIDSDTLQYNVFSLSAEGLLSAMVVDDSKASLIWWRTDKFIGTAQ
ncbi:MAG: hypothetical protein FWF29_02440 [Treponema sp.]|nr:hypothetical protein [Treponema sp.]